MTDDKQPRRILGTILIIVAVAVLLAVIALLWPESATRVVPEAP